MGETDANGNTTTHAYDNSRNLPTGTTLAQVTAADGCVSANGAPLAFVYDGAKNLVSSTDAQGETTNYGYDRENRRTSVSFAGETTQTRYNFFGKPTSIIKPLGNGKVFFYDAFKRLTGVTEGGPVKPGQPVDSIVAGLTTSYRYDLNDNLTHQLVPLNNTSTRFLDTEFRYDELNRRTDLIDHGDRTVTTHYRLDGEGNVTLVTDPKGQSIHQTFDALNRPTDASYLGAASPLNTLTGRHTDYDGNNNVTAVTETKTAPDGQTTVTDATRNTGYDIFDRLKSSLQRDLKIDYRYDNNGNRLSVATSVAAPGGGWLPSGSTAYAYDERNRLKTATPGGQGATGYCYRADGLTESIRYGNNTKSVYDYFDTKRVKSIRNLSGENVFSSYDYLYDRNGNRTSQTEQQNGITWYTRYYTAADGSGNLSGGYDQLDRLTSYTVQAGVETTRNDYSFEGYNRKTETVTVNGQLRNDKTYNYDGANRLVTVVDNGPQPKTVTYGYDDNGNTVLKTDSSLNAEYADTYFDYDVLNRLVQAKQAGNVLGQYDYDENNLRIRKLFGSGPAITYYHDGQAVIEEVNGTDDTRLKYGYTNGLLSLTTPDGTQYYHRDALGSTVNLTDQSGNVKIDYILSPFGRIVQSFGDSVNTHIFTGKEHDQNTGLVYFGQRYYDADTGRFITEDSYLGKSDTPPSLHRYLYAYSNPTVYIDLQGYASEKSEEGLWSRITRWKEEATEWVGKQAEDLTNRFRGNYQAKVHRRLAEADGSNPDEAEAASRKHTAEIAHDAGKQAADISRPAVEGVEIVIENTIAGGLAKGAAILGSIKNEIKAGEALVTVEDKLGKAFSKFKSLFKDEQVVKEEVGAVEEFAAKGVELKQYGGPGGGHHVPAKSAFSGASGYDVNAALAIPNAELARLGVRHGVVTGAQQTLYRSFAQSGEALTWEAMEHIETKALIRGGMKPEMAETTVKKAVQALKDAGVTGPTRIPWGN
ncbi:RHS repeat domain-containing protein [Geomonas sp. Red276]